MRLDIKERALFEECNWGWPGELAVLASKYRLAWDLEAHGMEACDV